MFLDTIGFGFSNWSLDLTDFELNLLIKSLDDSIELSERDNDGLDRMLKVLWGIRKQKMRGAKIQHPREFRLFLSTNGPGWRIGLTGFELDLVIRSLDDEVPLSDEDNDDLDKMLRLLWGIRQKLNPTRSAPRNAQSSVKMHRGFCTVCNRNLNPHEVHEHPRNVGALVRA